MLNIRELHNWATSSGVYLSFFFRDLLWFLSFAVLQSSHTAIPVSVSTYHQPIFQSNLLIQLSSPSHTYAKVFCFLLAAFSQLLPIPTEPHSEGGYEIFRVWAGLMFSTSVLYWVKIIFLTSSANFAFYVQHNGWDGPSPLYRLSAILSLPRREAPISPSCWHNFRIL